MHREAIAHLRELLRAKCENLCLYEDSIYERGLLLDPSMNSEIHRLENEVISVSLSINALRSDKGETR